MIKRIRLSDIHHEMLEANKRKFAYLKQEYLNIMFVQERFKTRIKKGIVIIISFLLAASLVYIVIIKIKYLILK